MLAGVGRGRARVWATFAAAAVEGGASPRASSSARRCCCRRSRSRSGCASRRAPWFFINDSTYQIELAGEPRARRPQPLRRATTAAPASSASTASTARRRHAGVARRAAPLRLLPRRGADRGRVGRPARAVRRRALARRAHVARLLPAALLFPGPRRASSRSACCWPRTRSSCAPRGSAPRTHRPCSCSCSRSRSPRRRPGWAGVALGAAILTKQFALVGLPFLAAMLVLDQGRDALRRAASPAPRWSRPASCRSWSPTRRALDGHGLATAPAPTGSSATASRRYC